MRSGAAPRRPAGFVNLRTRFRLTVIFQILVTGVLLARFFYIQGIERVRYAGLGESQSIRQVAIEPLRGRIYDRNGVPLALNVSLDSAGLRTLSGLSGTDSRALFRRPIRRLYPQDGRCGQMVGFVGRDGYGLAGVEYGYDRDLHGEGGWSVNRLDAQSRRVFEMDLPIKAPVDGRAVRLTLDVNVQEIAESCLRQGVVKTGAVAGAVIVMDPFTGDILGMASFPFFNPNGFVRQPADWARNNALSMIYEPGSTFKIVAAAAALEEGVFREEDILRTGDGKFEIYGEIIHDTHKHGDITFKQAIALSSNIAFAKIATGLGSAKLYQYIRNFGFGQKLSVALPGEESGLLKPVERWSGRTLVTLAMGQEIAVTLLQMGAAYCAVANGGVLMTPRVVSGLSGPGGAPEQTVEIRPLRRVISPRTAKRLTDCLTAVVDEDSGTGTFARIEGVSVAGKTGTAQKIDPETRRYMADKYVATFAGFFPAERPELMCMVLLDEPQRVYYGGLTAAPVFREIATRILHSQALPYGARVFGPSRTSDTDRSVRVPDCKGAPLDSAIARCGRAGLRVEIAGVGGSVERQTPAAGKVCPEGGTVRIVTGETPRRLFGPVPDVTGLSVREAVGRLMFRGFAVRVQGSGRVLRQEPPAGTAVKEQGICLIEAG